MSEVDSQSRHSSPDQHAWRRPGDEMPPRGQAVLCAWGTPSRWQYGIAKWTGKRWLDVIPETANEQYFAPAYWQRIEAPR